MTFPMLLFAFAVGPGLGPDWKTGAAHPFREALDEGAGFSFTYDGKLAGPALPAEWEVTRTTSGETRFRHPSGLAAIRVVRQFPGSEAIEYTVKFKNESSSESRVLGPIDAIDISFGGRVFDGAAVVSSSGGSGDSMFPPGQYSIRERLMGRMSPPAPNSVINIGSTSGKPSRGDLPFFFLEDRLRSAGVFVAIGWTGVWSARIAGDFEKNTLSVKGGVPGIRLTLRPGEEISGPRILLGAYRGPLTSGSNRLRRLLREQYTPLLEGAKPLPVMQYSSWYSVFTSFDETLLRRLADVAHELGQEYFEVDSGWFAGTRMGPTNGEWQYGVGNWEKVCPHRFPSGLRPLVDYVRSKGMKFGLWFEPERAVQTSLIAKAHPEWMIWPPGKRDPSNERAWGLVNFGLPDVQKWMTEFLSRYIREYDIQYVRWDLNVGPAAVWAAADPPGQSGRTEIRYVEGLHQVLKELLRRHPGTLIENCAGGGGRVDLASAGNAHAFWVTNHTTDPNVVRYHLAGLHRFLPGNYFISAFQLPVWYRKRFDFPDIAYQSFFAGAFSTSGNLTEWPAEMRARAKNHIGVFKDSRRFLVEDYYPLARQAQDLESWEGWQFHDPKTGEGFAQVFRTNSPDRARSFPLQALDAKAAYLFTDPYTGSTTRISGAEAGSRGLRFELPEMSSAVRTYRKVP